MKTTLSRTLAFLLILSFSSTPVWATCGGGGGGGTGGVGGGNNTGGPAPTVYNVPWEIWNAKTPPSKGLVLYWFPLTNDELKRSPMKTSRILTLYSAQCVSMSAPGPECKTPASSRCQIEHSAGEETNLIRGSVKTND